MAQDLTEKYTSERITDAHKIIDNLSILMLFPILLCGVLFGYESWIGFENYRHQPVMIATFCSIYFISALSWKRRKNDLYEDLFVSLGSGFLSIVSYFMIIVFISVADL